MEKFKPASLLGEGSSYWTDEGYGRIRNLKVRPIEVPDDGPMAGVAIRGHINVEGLVVYLKIVLDLEDLFTIVEAVPDDVTDEECYECALDIPHS